MSDLSARLGLPMDRPPRVVAVGAHPDDIEIGAGGTILRLLAERPDVEVRFAVLAGSGERAAEARDSAEALGESGGGSIRLDLLPGRDGHLPYADPSATKDAFRAVVPADADLVLVHRRDDAHQDHRFAADLVWQTFRWATILEYEIPKWDGDLGRVDLYVTLDAAIAAAKVDHLSRSFPSQHEKDWYTADTFRAILRLRGVECRAPDGAAEAFVSRKLVL